jgi:tripartite-type tricarboxylate transporter receptor subunit TctC
MKTKWMILFCSVLIAYPILGASQEKYPTRPITIIQYSGPGSSADIVTKVFCEAMKKELGGNPIITKYSTGGGGSIAVGELVRSRPDGYTIGVANMGALAVVPHINPVKYDPLKDIEYHGSYMVFLLGWVVKADSPFKNVKDLVEAARKTPEKLTFGNGTPGGIMGLGVAYMEKAENVLFKNVPFSGATAEAMTALLGGHVDFIAANPPLIQQYLKSGHVRMLVSTSSIRHTDPNAPTLRELGYDFDQESFAAIGSPKGISPYIKKRLDEAVQNAVQNPEYVQTTKKMDTPIGYVSGEGYKKRVEQYYKQWGALLTSNYRY